MKNIFCLLVSFIGLSCCSLLNAQVLDSVELERLLSLRNEHYEQADYIAHQEITKKLAEHYLNVDPVNHEKLTGLFNEMGNASYYLGAIDAAVDNYELSRTHAGLSVPPNLKRMAYLSFNVGLIHFAEGDYYAANTSVSEAIEQLNEVPEYPEKTAYLARFYVGLSSIKGQQGRYEEENIYLKYALNLIQGVEESWQAKLDVYIGLAINAGDRRDFAEERYYVKIAQDLFNKYFPSHHYDAPKLNTTIANSFYNQKQYLKAIDYHKKNLEFYELYYPGQDLEKTISLENLGNCYSKLGEYKKAEPYLLRVIEIYDLLQDRYSPRYAPVYQLLADCYEGMGDFDKTIQFLEKGFEKIGYDLEQPYVFKQVQGQLALMELVQTKAYKLLNKYKETKKVTYLHGADTSFQIALALMDTIDLQQQLETQEEQAFKANYYSVFEGAIQAKYLLDSIQVKPNYSADAFYWNEKSKNNQLRKGIHQQAVLEKSGVESSWLTAQQKLKNSYGEKLTQSYQRNLPDSTKSAIEEELFQLRERLWEEKQQLSTDFPMIQKIQSAQIPSLAEVQSSLLSDREAVLEYFVGESFACRWWISKQTILFERISHLDSLKAEMTQFRENLYNKADCKTLNTIAYQLYRRLFPNEDQVNLDDIDELTIIPSGAIALIPFELLQVNSSNDDCSQASYLFKEKQIHYRYSGLVKPLAHQAVQPSNSLVGFAPDYQTPIEVMDTATNAVYAALVRSGVYDLPGAKQEVDAVGEIMKGTIFSGAAANEAQFRAQANQYKILHFAMHAVANVEEPLLSYLLFSQADTSSKEDDRLHAIELYNMQIPAEMAVLSACNSGFGQIKKGEGVLSLAHAFTYAGVPSTVMSLWKVPDEATAQIMIDFYKNLEKGQNKAEALRQAKLSWLQNDAISEQLKHPYYWAGFIVTGDIAPITTSTFSWYLLALGALVLFSLYWWFQKKK